MKRYDIKLAVAVGAVHVAYRDCGPRWALAMYRWDWGRL